MPPPSVKPATPVVEMIPGGHRQSERVGGVVHVAPTCHRRPPYGPRFGIDVDVFIGERSMTRPSSQTPSPPALWPPPGWPPADLLTGELHGSNHIGHVAATAISCGLRSIMALYTLRASSYRASVRSINSPRRWLLRDVNGFLIHGSSEP